MSKVNKTGKKETVSLSSLPSSTNSSELDDIRKDLAEIKTIVKSFKKELKGLVEIQQRLVHERLGVPVPPAPKEYGEEPANKAKINIVSLGEDKIRVSGNTFDFKSTIKEAGISKWEQATKSWSGPLECLDQLISALEAVNLVKDVDFIVDVKEGDNKGENKGESEKSEKSKEESEKESEKESEDKNADKDSDDEGFGSGYTTYKKQG
jgi:hypothetical protein